MIGGFTPSRLYAILDAESCARRGLGLLSVAQAWRAAGIRLLQYRDKSNTDAAVLSNARAIGDVFASSDAVLILNDRVHLVSSAGWHGVHVGQGDMRLAEARAIIGPKAILGASTHTAIEVEAANHQDCDYIAVGPVFATATKLDAEASVGLAGVRAARALTAKPLVAIGGITRASVAEVRAAGADSLAVISALLPAGVDGANGLKRTAQDFLRALQ